MTNSDAVSAPASNLTRIAIACAACFAGAAWLGARASTTLPFELPIWPLSAVLLSILITRPAAEHNLGLVAAFAAGWLMLTFNFRIEVALAYASLEIIQVWLTLLLLRIYLRYPNNLTDIAQYANFLFVAAVLVPLPFIGVEIWLVQTLFGLPDSNLWWIWYLAEFLSIALITPAVVWILTAGKNREELLRKLDLECAANVATVIVASFAVFRQSGTTLPFILGPLLFWGAIRCHFVVTGINVLTVITAALLTLMMQTGGWIDEASLQSLAGVQPLQLYFAIVVLPPLFVSMTLEYWRRAEDSLRRSEERFRQIAENIEDVFWVSSLDWREAHYISPAYEKIFGRSCQSLYEDPTSWLRAIHPQDLPVVRRTLIATKSGQFGTGTSFRIYRPDGSERWVRGHAYPVKEDDGEPKRLVGILEDITEQKQAAIEIAEINAQFQNAFEHAPHGMGLVAMDNSFMQVNEALCILVGYPEDELLALAHYDITHPEDHEQDQACMHALLQDGLNSYQFEKRYIHKAGHEVPVRLSVSIVLDADGNPLHTVSQVLDLTALKESEERLRQSQKMEAMGQLTGGVAHDFNNLLAIILGNLSLLADDLEDGRTIVAAEALESIRPALEASQRGAELTHRLLAFSRTQPLQPVALEVNSVVDGMEGLLRTTLGENIEIVWQPGTTGWLTEIDPSELENVLLNLALNARDAMLDGGKLTIETGEVCIEDEPAALNDGTSAGEYVTLTVTDTGIGMDANTLEKAFEPFFTTKDVGQGTGLGLSMVYGFANQSGGYVNIDSKPDEGTMVRLFLPRSALATADELEGDIDCQSPRGNETILIVEDDQDVQHVMVKVLSRLGYKILSAGDGPQALDILSAEDRIDLLLSDVVLPGGLSGADVARSALEISPAIKVLYVSGYTEDAILHQGRIAKGVNFIGKPFSQSNLGARVREVLDSA